MLLAAIFDAIIRGKGRATTQTFRVSVAVLYMMTFISHSLLVFQWQQTILLLIVSFGVPYATEAFGVRFGIPFGRYAYTGGLKPFLPLGVPLYVVLVWGLLIYSSLFVGRALGTVYQAIAGEWAQIITISLVTVLIDGVLDPVAVRIGHWRWYKTGRWFGIPAENFVGWFVTAFATVFFLNLLGIRLSTSQVVTPSWLYFLPVLMLGLFNIYLSGLLRKFALGRLIPYSILIGVGLVTLYSYFIFHISQ